MGDVIADECIHGLTTAWCSICKAQSKLAEKRRRLAREARHPAFETEPSLPYPTVVAQWDGICASCDERYPSGTTIYRADGGWCCQQCAEDYHTLGVGTDG